ncbi:hypothetical protein EMIT0P218_180060 [Pseudomonas sp. IT-P218]
MAQVQNADALWPSACNLTEGRCNELLQQVAHGMDMAMTEMADHIKGNRHFASVGEALMEQWKSGMARSLVKS